MTTDVAATPSTHGTRADDPRRMSGQSPLWPHAANAVLGAWLATFPATVQPHPATLVGSDVVAGILIMLLSGLACSPRFRWTAWLTAGIGLWLLVAPLIFWAPTAAAYSTSNLLGVLVFTFAVLIPGTPGARDLPGPDIPPGWAYNPSAWPQRGGIITLALLQYFAARYMAAHQLGHVSHAWDPLFGSGTYRVLNSDVSKAFPISDAGFGAFTYLLEALTGFLGGTRRWRTMPWVVLLFGFLVVPVGVVSIVLVILQPLAVGAWCGLCLFTAIVTVFMISPALDEVIATGQFLLRSRRAGQPFWRTFWLGGTDAGSGGGREQPQSLLREIADGLEVRSVPWNLVPVAILGVWLMISPAVLGLTDPAAANVILVGALVITFAVIGFGESARGARWVCLPLAAWLVLSPLVLGSDTSAPRWPEVVVGLLIILLVPRRGPVKGRFGSWDRYVV